ncbi:MAG TPA: manganese-dependent inorganic pyrophosphatase [Candidatus Portnoybacteria bacterium]|nr:manganese-dependent inorganic pyrophosphatase [Candidatus Portnoybacteria bacterium]
MIVVIGHKNPDTDSVVSAIVGSYLFNQLGFNSKPARAGELNKETKFILNYFKKNEPELISNLAGQDFILVDHNSVKESVDGRDDHRLAAVIDHHYLSGVQTEKPILYRAEPIGSTSTILAKMFWEKKIDLPQDLAGLLLAGIISDTLKFNSPTTTKEDKEIAQKLADLTKVDIDQLAEQMFEAKSDLGDLSWGEIISKDYKVFEGNSKTFGVGVWETVKPELLLRNRDKIIESMRRKKEIDRLDWFLFGVVDIIKQNTYLFLVDSDETELAQVVFNGKIENRIMFLPGIISRKKQMVPEILKYLNK